MTHRGSSGWFRWLAATPALILLLGVVLHWLATRVEARTIQLGEAMWDQYALELRREVPRPVPPDERVVAPESTPDDDLLDALLGGDDAGTGADGKDPLDDLLEGLDAPTPASDTPDAGTPPPATGGGGSEGGDDPDLDALLGGDGSDDSLIDELLNDELGDAAPPRIQERDPQEVYEEDLAHWEATQVRLTPAVRAYRTLDRVIAGFVLWGSMNFGGVLAVLVAICGAAATAARGHISLRPATTRLEGWISDGAQVVANLVVVASMVALYLKGQSSGAEIQHPEVPLLWAGGFGLMAALSLKNLLVPLPVEVDGTRGSVGRGLLAIPLYGFMALVAGSYFLGVEQYPAGLAVYLRKLSEHAQLYIFVGLYVWGGMLLKETRLARLFFDVVRPWHLPPEVIAAGAVALAAIPTAYSGASGIFVIAVGAVIFTELRQAGARPGLALAATAMSGSLGVVLRPCLLVVIVAFLNPVTSDVLYGWGRYVFLLSASVFAILVFLTRQNRFTMAPPGVALPVMTRNLTRLLWYVGVLIGLLLFFWFALGSALDEHTAAPMLPLVLLVVLSVEQLIRDPGIPAAVKLEKGPVRRGGEALGRATWETTGHIGALVLLMALSVSVGGIVERGELMSYLPQQLGSVWLAMAVLLVILVLIGMTMDPYGAVILVSSTLTALAAANGIHEAHFWMVVLVAFELGYLTPPVALNHLLTRQVVGAEAYAEAQQVKGSFWYRHERLLLPMATMAITLLLVAFVPLLFGVSSHAATP